MSIKVTVNGSPVCMRRGKMLLTDPDVWKRNEFNRRRKLRIEQVRQQSKDVASRLRKQFRKERDKQLSEFEEEQIAELKRQHARKLLNLQQKYQDCLGDVGRGHTRASMEPDPVEILAEQRKRNQLLAEQRGREAQEKERKESVALEREKERLCEIYRQNRIVEDLRSTMVVSINKSTEKTPLRTISNIPARNKHETRVKTSFPFKKKSPKKKSSRKIPSLSGVSSPDEDESDSDGEMQPSKADASAVPGTSTRHEDTTSSDTSTANVVEQDKHPDAVNLIELPTCFETLPKTVFETIPKTTREAAPKTVRETVPKTVLTDVAHESGPRPVSPVKQFRAKPANKVPVQYYDHSARFHREYSPRPVVQRISPRKQIEEKSSVDVEEQMAQAALLAASERERAAQRERRGHQAMARERAQRDYKQLMGELDVLTREERRLRGSHPPFAPPPEVHMSDGRLRQHQHERQARMDTAFEGIMHAAQFTAERDSRPPSVAIAESTTTTTRTTTPSDHQWQPSPATLNVGRLPPAPRQPCPCPRRSPSPPPVSHTTTSSTAGSVVVGRLPTPPPRPPPPPLRPEQTDSLERLMARVNEQRRLLLEEVGREGTAGGGLLLQSLPRDLPALKRPAERDIFSSSSSSEASAATNDGNGMMDERGGELHETRGEEAWVQAGRETRTRDRHSDRLDGNVHETEVKEVWLPAGEGGKGKGREKRWRQRTDIDGITSRTVVSEYSVSKTELSATNSNNNNNSNNSNDTLNGTNGSGSTSASFQGIKVIVSVTEAKKITDVITNVRTRRRSPGKRGRRGKRREEVEEKGQERGRRGGTEEDCRDDTRERRGETEGRQERERKGETEGRQEWERRGETEEDSRYDRREREEEELDRRQERGRRVEREKEGDLGERMGDPDERRERGKRAEETAARNPADTRRAEATRGPKPTPAKAGPSDSPSSTCERPPRVDAPDARERGRKRVGAVDSSSTAYDSPPGAVEAGEAAAVGRLLETISRQQRRLDEWKATVVVPPTKTLEDYVDILLAMPQEAVDALTDVSSVPSPPSSIFDTPQNRPPEGGRRQPGDPLDDLLQARIREIARELARMDDGGPKEAGGPGVLGEMTRQVRERSRTREAAKQKPPERRDASTSPARGKRESGNQTDDRPDAAHALGGSTRVPTARDRGFVSCLPSRRSKSKDKGQSASKDKEKDKIQPKDKDKNRRAVVEEIPPYVEFRPTKTSSKEQAAHGLDPRQCADQALACAERITALNRQLESIRQENKRFLAGAHGPVVDSSKSDSYDSVHRSREDSTKKDSTTKDSTRDSTGRNTLDSTKYESPPGSVATPRETAPPPTLSPSYGGVAGDRGVRSTDASEQEEEIRYQASVGQPSGAVWQREYNVVATERDPRRLSTIVEADSPQVSTTAVGRYLAQDARVRSYVSEGPLLSPSGVPQGSMFWPQGIPEGSMLSPHGVPQGSMLSPQGVPQESMFSQRGVPQGSSLSQSTASQGPLHSTNDESQGPLLSPRKADGRKSPEPPLPDVMSEMLRRRLITSPLPWARADERGARGSADERGAREGDVRRSLDYYPSMLTDISTGPVSPPPLSPPPAVPSWRDASTQSSTAGAEQDPEAVDSTAEDLEGVFTRLGYGWASATLRKTQAAKDLSSSSSPDADGGARGRRGAAGSAARRSGERSGGSAQPPQRSTPSQERTPVLRSPTQQRQSSRQRSTPTQHSTPTQQRASTQRTASTSLDRSLPRTSRGHSTPVKTSTLGRQSDSSRVSPPAFPARSDLSTVGPDPDSSEDHSLTAPDVALRIPKRSPDGKK